MPPTFKKKTDTEAIKQVKLQLIVSYSVFWEYWKELKAATDIHKRSLKHPLHLLSSGILFDSAIRETAPGPITLTVSVQNYNQYLLAGIPKTGLNCSC